MKLDFIKQVKKYMFLENREYRKEFKEDIHNQLRNEEFKSMAYFKS